MSLQGSEPELRLPIDVELAEGPGFERFPYEPVEPAFSRGKAIWTGIGLSALGIWLVSEKFVAGAWLEFTLTLVFFLFFALLAFGLVPERAPRGNFRYINATVMTRAEKPTADSWVHLAPTRKPRLAMVLAWALGALAMTAVALYTLLAGLGVLPMVNENTGRVGHLLLFLLTAAIAAVCVWVAGLFIGRSLRASSFGRRPSGVALGSSGVMVNVPGREAEIPWAQIKSVSPHRIEINTVDDSELLFLGRRRRREALDCIRLVLHPGGDITAKVQYLSATGYAVPSDALFTALRWYHANRDAQRELGRVEGERRIAGWRGRALEQTASEGAAQA